MRKKKKAKKDRKRIWFKRSGNSKSKKRVRKEIGPALMRFLKIAAVVCVASGAAGGMVFLEDYVQEGTGLGKRRADLKIVGAPSWVNERLERKVYSAAVGGTGALTVGNETAERVYENLAREVEWLEGVRVQTARDGIYVRGRWRRPVAMVKRGVEKFYVDEEKVVMTYVPLSNLPIVEIEGLSVMTELPGAGEVWHREDATAAVEVLTLLRRRERYGGVEASVLDEIACIDVSNFKGRENKGFPHIVLYAKDRTEIIWGAEVGQWHQHFEVRDEEKVARLYSYHKKYGSLQLGAKYIDLSTPLDEVPLPVDRY